MVATSVIPAQKATIKKIACRGQPDKKLAKTYLNQLMCHSGA
jgi:hypothetical protein